MFVAYTTKHGGLATLTLLCLVACSDEAAFPSAESSDAGSERGSDDDDDEASDSDGRSEPEPFFEPDPRDNACPERLKSRCTESGDGPRPDRLSEHSAVYDDENQVMYIFGGTPSIPVNCGPGPVEFVNRLWRYDDPCGRFELLETEDGPGPRGRHMATFGDGRLWIFGGRFREGTSGPYELYDELWAYDPNEESWQLASDDGARPTARISSAFVYDGSRQRLWLMGGNQAELGTAYLPTNDVWSYSLAENRWQQHNTSVGPSPRLFHAATLDAVRDRLVVFGGADETAFSGSASYFSDLWALDLDSAEWERIAATSSGPRGRFWSSLVHDGSTDTYLLFGGHDDTDLGNRNDTWRFNPESEEWTRDGGEDALQGEARGFCDFPPDFVDVDLALPERRNAHTLVWSESCGHALLFAGKTDCGSADDLWAFTDEWQVRNRAFQGEVCARFSPNLSDCSDICF